MQNRIRTEIDLKSWTIIQDGYDFAFYNKNVKFYHRDKFPWLIGEFKINLNPYKDNRTSIRVSKMVPSAFPLIYQAEKKYLDQLKGGKSYEVNYQHESKEMFFTSPFSHDYEKRELYKLGCSQYSDRFFMSSAELGLYAHAQCNDNASYAEFIKDGLFILALVDSSLYEAIVVLQTEINKISKEIKRNENRQVYGM